MQNEHEYVVKKLQSCVFNLSVIAPIIGVNRHTLELIRNGKTANPNKTTIAAIANFIRQVGN
jgi:DNA-binding XRE family transcriptional regulator